MAHNSRAERLEKWKERGGWSLSIALPILLSAGVDFIFGPVASFFTLVVLGNLSLFMVTGQAGFTLLEIVIWACAPFSLSMYILYPVVLHSIANSKATTCISNAHQLGVGTLLYAQDYDGVLPYDAASFRTLISPHVKDRKSFACPLDVPGVTSYTFNSNLANVPTSTVTSLEQTVLIYEGKAGKLNYRHAGRASIAFTDGYCRFTVPNQITTLLWTAPISKE